MVWTKTWGTPGRFSLAAAALALEADTLLSHAPIQILAQIYPPAWCQPFLLHVEGKSGLLQERSFTLGR